MTDGIGFDYPTGQPEAQGEGINLLPSSPVLPDDILHARAARADYALGQDSPGLPALKDEFRAGRENQVRQTAASKADTAFKAEKIAAVQKTIDNGAPLTDQDINQIVSLGTTPQANPDTVLEDKFANNLVTTGDAGEPDKNYVMKQAFDKNPERAQEGLKISTAMASNRQQAHNVLEEVQAAYDNLPWVAIPSMGIGAADQQDKLGSHAKNLFSMGIAQYVNQRNLMNAPAENSLLSILPGRNKLEQIEALYLRPEGVKQALMAVAGPQSELFKKAPGDTLDFVRAAVQFSTSDSYVDDTMGVLNVAGLIPAGSIAKGVSRLRNASASAANRVATAAGVAEEILSASSKARSVASKGNANDAAQTALDVLGTSSQAPTPGYYVPEAAVKRPWETSARLGAVKMENGVPRVFTEDGAEVAVSRTPEAGMIKIEPQGSTTTKTITNKEGTFTPEPNTVYVDKAGYTKLSAVLDENQNYVLLQDDKGAYFVGDRAKGGKMVPGTKTKVSSEPAEGLHPVRIPEGNDPIKFEDFGSRITRVDENVQQNVKFGPTIVDQSEKDARQALADITKAGGYDHPQDALSKMGMHNRAAEAGVEERLAIEAGQPPVDPPNNIRRAVPSNAQPGPYPDNVSGMSWRRTQEIINEFKAALGATRVERLPPAAYDQAITVAKTAVSKYNRISSDAIRDQVSHWDSLTNTYRVETKIGKPNGELFDSRGQATHYKNLQYRMGSSATVEREGTKFYLSHNQHADETQSVVRENLPVGNETPRGFLKSALALITGQVGPNLRSSAYTVSGFQRTARTTATHAPSFLRGAIEEEAQTLKNLSNAFNKTERNELNDILVHNRDYIPPGGTGRDRGFFYNSQHEFEQAFFNKFQKQPTDAQWEAYESYTRLSDLDWVLRESELYRDKARLGVRKYNVKFTNREGNNVETGFVDGKEVKDLYPLSTPDANVYVIPDNSFVTKYDLKDASAHSKYVNDKLKSGEYKIVQLYDPRSKPLKEATGIKDDIHFVITNKMDERAIQFGENVDYRPGGHVIYQGQHYVKQPQIGLGAKGRPTYFGDVSLKAFETEKEAKLWADKYTQAGRLLNDPAFDAYVSANLPETPAELRRMFNDGTFDPSQAFHHTLSGRDVLQSNAEFLKNNPQFQGLKDTFSAYNLSQLQENAFLADRGTQLNTIKNAGTEANPIWNNVSAPLLDPYSSLGQGLAQVVRSRWMSDYKIQAAESWVAEFGHLFDQSKLPIDKLRQNPMYYLNHVDTVDRGVIKANPEAYAAMMTSRDNILRFIGSRDEVGGMIDGLTNRIVAGIDNVAGTKWAGRAEVALPKIKSIPEYMRRVTFDMVDGLFNVVQLPQQALGAAHAVMISPMNGMKGLTASGLVRAMRHTEDAAIIDRFGDIAANMGWNKRDFLEAYTAWKESGVHNVGGEYVSRTVEEPTLYKSTLGSWIDKGRYFFKKGEEINRDTSYFTAYHDWRDQNPGRAFDNRAKTEVLARFDTLNMNMTKASNAAYNEGILSVPTQFWSWNIRFAEQMLSFGAGRQLSVAEKARVFAGNSMLWGVPSALGGATLGVLPYLNYDDIKQEAIKRGFNINDKFLASMTDGLAQTMFNMISGREPGKETSLRRFSPNADQLRIFKDIQTGKKEWVEFFLGASGSMAYKLLASVQPFTAYSMSAFSKEGDFKIKMNDFVNVAENISSFNNAERAWVAWNTGRYISKNEQLQTEVDKFESVMLGLGLQPQRVQDAWQMKSILEGRKSAQDKLSKKVMEDSAIAFRAMQDGDGQTFHDYMSRVKTYMAMGNFTLKEEREIWRRATRGQDSLIDNVNRQWLQRDPRMNTVPNVKQYFENMNNGNR